MSYLLDTHALLWAFGKTAELSERVRSILRDDDADIFVSAVTAYEIALKRELGKLEVPLELAIGYEQALRDGGFLSAPLDTTAALRAGKLVMDHRDPFDRLLSAQAMQADWTFLSKDVRVDVFGVRRLW